jgi:hypothetical protein
MSPTAARNVAVATRFTPGTVISRLASGECSICLAISRSTSAISRSRNAICLSAACTVSASSTGSCSERSHLRPLTPNKSEHGDLPCSRRVRTAWTSFLTRVRERTSCSRRANRRRNTRQRSSGIHTASSSPCQSSLASARASSLSVLVRACAIPVSSGETTITFCTCGSSSRATSHAPPETSSATRSVDSRLAANASSAPGVMLTRPAERTTPSSQIAISQKSRCKSRPIPRPTHLNNCDTSHLPSVTTRRTSGRTTPTDTCSRHNPGKSQGRPKRTARARGASSKTACPPTFPQEGPRPGSPDRTFRAGRSLRVGFSCHEQQASRSAIAVRRRSCFRADAAARRRRSREHPAWRSPGQRRSHRTPSPIGGSCRRAGPHIREGAPRRAAWGPRPGVP